MKNIIYLHILLLYYSVIGIISKTASQHQLLSRDFIVLYVIIISMTLIYAFFWQQVIKRFSLVIAYSNKAITVFWILLWSALFFNEKITLNNLLGAIIIVIGIIMVVKESE